MKLYIAARVQEDAKALKDLLEANGHQITSRWITLDTKFNLGLDAKTDAEKNKLAHIDEEDVRAATDGVVLIATENNVSKTGGKHFETGIARGLNRPIYVIGKRENIFHWLDTCRVFDTAEDFLNYINQLSSMEIMQKWKNYREAKVRNYEYTFVSHKNLIEEDQVVITQKQLEEAVKIVAKEFITYLRTSEPSEG